MSLRMHVCLSVGMYTCVHVRMYVGIYKYMYACLYVCVYVLYVHMYVHIHERTYVLFVCMSVCMYVHLRKRMYVCMHQLKYLYRCGYPSNSSHRFTTPRTPCACICAICQGRGMPPMKRHGAPLLARDNTTSCSCSALGRGTALRCGKFVNSDLYRSQRDLQQTPCQCVDQVDEPEVGTDFQVR